MSGSEADAPPVAEMRFEQALAALEDVVSRLESGRVPLDESIALYERGAALRERCEALLRDAELKVQKIVAREGAPPELEPVAPEAAPPPDPATRRAAAKSPQARDSTADEDDIPF